MAPASLILFSMSLLLLLHHCRCGVLQIRSIERQRVGMYRQMRQLRQELHAMVLQQHSRVAATAGAALAGAQDAAQQHGMGQGRQGSQEQQQRETAKRVMLLLGGVDDVVSDAAAVSQYCLKSVCAPALRLFAQHIGVPVADTQ
jgi:hypothetical protein